VGQVRLGQARQTNSKKTLLFLDKLQQTLPAGIGTGIGTRGLGGKEIAP
jgi:hypothetical protein